MITMPNRYALLLLSAILGGCAVQGQPGKGMQIGIDNAALFGRELAQIVLPDGGTASLREFERTFSLKLQAYSRVIAIDKASSVSFRSAQEVDAYTLIVLDKAEPGCRHKLHLIAVKGAEVRSWDFGNCESAPVAAIDENGARFDVSSGMRTTRYEFSQGRLMYGVLPAIPASLAAPTRQAGGGTAGARPVQVAVVAQHPSSGANSRKPAEPPAPDSERSGVSAAAAPEKGPKRRSVLPSGTLVFERNEQAPRTMYLGK